MLTIRPAALTDIPAIAKIYGHAVLSTTATFELEPPAEEEVAQRFAQLSAFPYLIAEVDQVVAGYAYASPYRPRPAYRHTIEDSIYVDPGHAGRGLGKALLGSLIEACQGRDWRQMIAVIGDSGNAASIRVHQGLGFQYVGVLRGVGFKFGRWLDTVMMQREL